MRNGNRWGFEGGGGYNSMAWPKLEPCDRYVTDGETWGCVDCGHGWSAHQERWLHVKIDRILEILEGLEGGL